MKVGFIDVVVIREFEKQHRFKYADMTWWMSQHMSQSEGHNIHPACQKGNVTNMSQR